MSRFLLGASLLLCSLCTSAADAPRTSDAERIRHGRYVVEIAGCNDCHTAGYAPSGGEVPEAQWLTGDTLGFAGPWGTTYPGNLRLRLNAMDLATFKHYARTLRTRPPMPYWALNAMNDTDLEALYAFVKSLGPAGEPAPAALQPGVEALGPVVRFPAPPPLAAR